MDSVSPPSPISSDDEIDEIEDTNCKSKLKTIKSKYDDDEDYGKIVTLTGAWYEVKGSHIVGRRRRLFQGGPGGDS